MRPFIDSPRNPISPLVTPVASIRPTPDTLKHGFRNASVLLPGEDVEAFTVSVTRNRRQHSALDGSVEEGRLGRLQDPERRKAANPKVAAPERD